MKRNISIIIIPLLLAILSMPVFGQGSAMNVGSDWRLGNIVYYDIKNIMSLIDATGPNVHKYITHFVSWDGDTTSSSILYDSEWITTERDTSFVRFCDSSRVYHIDSVGGAIKLIGFDDTTGVQIQLRGESFKLDTSSIAYNILYFGARVLIDEDSTATAHVGLMPIDTLIIAHDTTYDGIYFRMQDDSANAKFVTELNGSETETVIGTVANGGVSDSTWSKIEFYAVWDGTEKGVYAFKDDSLVATHTTNQNICTDENLTPTFAWRCGAVSMYNRGLIIDWLRVIQIRIVQ